MTGGMYVKYRYIVLLLLCILLCGCAEQQADTTDPTYWLNMGLDFPISDTLPDGQGQKAKVILLLGQSNATGYPIFPNMLRSSGISTITLRTLLRRFIRWLTILTRTPLIS